jgi:DNA-binding LytR/AlgR family response regulator
MKVVIIEDEKPAAEKLQKSLQKIDGSIEVMAVLSSVKETLSWLLTHEQPELFLMDISLTDGLSFKIFEQQKINCPVIFTTAYDEYWQEAFEYNSIDYLLKPIKQEKLEAAIKKYDSLKQYFANNFKNMLSWQQQSNGMGYKKRFLVKRGIDFISIKTEEIAYFYATHKLVCLVDSNNQKYILDQSLADIEKQLDPLLFYRVNRKFLIQMNAIKRIKSSSKSRLSLEVYPPVNEEISISPENASAFKDWMGH